jgi:hypothetical protein
MSSQSWTTLSSQKSGSASPLRKAGGHLRFVCEIPGLMKQRDRLGKSGYCAHVVSIFLDRFSIHFYEIYFKTIQGRFVKCVLGAKTAFSPYILQALLDFTMLIYWADQEFDEEGRIKTIMGCM